MIKQKRGTRNVREVDCNMVIRNTWKGVRCGNWDLESVREFTIKILEEEHPGSSSREKQLQRLRASPVYSKNWKEGGMAGVDNRSQKQRGTKLVHLCEDFGFTLNKLRSHWSVWSWEITGVFEAWSNWSFNRITLPILFRDPAGLRIEGGRKLGDP